MVETHRDRMTTDLLFTLQLLDCFPDLLDCFPDLRLTADLSHYLVGREFAWPVDDTNHALIHRILDNAWGIHGRIASREQVQISLGFPQHQGWVGLFEQWWEYGIRSWKKRAGRAYCGRAASPDNRDTSCLLRFGQRSPTSRPLTRLQIWENGV